MEPAAKLPVPAVWRTRPVPAADATVRPAVSLEQLVGLAAEAGLGCLAAAEDATATGLQFDFGSVVQRTDAELEQQHYDLLQHQLVEQ